MAGNDLSITAGEMAYFDAGKSTDSDGKIVSYLWDFGDAKKALGVKVSHSYNNAGQYNVVLTAKDDKGLENSDKLVVTVNKKSEQPPVPKISSWQLDGQKIYQILTNGQKTLLTSLATNARVISSFSTSDRQEITSTQTLSSDTLDIEPNYLNTKLTLKTNGQAELIKEWKIYDSLNYTSRVSFLTYNNDNKKVYYVQDFAPFSNAEVKPIFNYNLTTGQIEGLTVSGSYENRSGHTSAILPIYLSANERKFAYENSITVNKPIIKIEGLGVNLTYEIKSQDLGLAENIAVDFSCLEWTADNNYLTFAAKEIVSKKDLGFFIDDLVNRVAYPLKDGACSR